MSAIEKNPRIPVQSTKPEVRKCGIGMINRPKKKRKPSQQSPTSRSRRPEENEKDDMSPNALKLDPSRFHSDHTSDEEKIRRFEIYGTKMMPTYVLDSGNRNVFGYCVLVQRKPMSRSRRPEEKAKDYTPPNLLKLYPL